MKKWGVIVAVAAFAILVVTELVRDVCGNEPIGYFSGEPGRLLYVVGIAILGGLATLGFSKLPPRMQRHVRIFGLGAAAITVTAAASYLSFGFFSLASIVTKHGLSVWPLLSMWLPRLLMLFAMAAFCSFGCWRGWKTGAPR